ncbi:MAG: hypothetical protein ABI615_13720 [Chthoniobacterales bacterium]
MKSSSPLPFASLCALRVRQFLLLALLAATAYTASAAADPTKISVKGFTHAADDKQKIPFTIEAKQAPYKATDTPLVAMGTDGGKVTPKFICTALSLTIGGKKMEIPEKAFSDLCDISQIAPPRYQMGFWLMTVKGGSGPTAYNAEYMFDPTHVLERGYLVNIPGPKWLRTVWQRDKY